MRIIEQGLALIADALDAFRPSAYTVMRQQERKAAAREERAKTRAEQYEEWIRNQFSVVKTEARVLIWGQIQLLYGYNAIHLVGPRGEVSIRVEGDGIDIVRLDPTHETLYTFGPIMNRFRDSRFLAHRILQKAIKEIL